MRAPPRCANRATPSARLPTAAERQILQQAFARQLARFTARPNDARKYVSQGESPRDESLAVPELAALLDDKEFRVRRNATLALDRLLPKADASAARRAVPGLLKIIASDPNADLRLYATFGTVPC